MPVIKAKLLFVLCERLPMLPSGSEVGCSVKEILRPKEDESDIAPAGRPRLRHLFWGLILTVAMFVGVVVYI